MEINSLDTRDAVRHWPVFRDGNVRRFLILWIEKQIATLGTRLEKISEHELKTVQGQIAGLRMLRTVLDKTNIETEIADLQK